MKFYGYRRADGSVGCRNLVAVIPSVVCAADVAQAIVQNVQGAVGLFHHQGCSQLPPDLKRVTDTLIGLALNPNVGAVLIVSLGCEGTDHARMYQEIQAAGKPVEIIGIQKLGGVSKAIAAGIDAAAGLVRKISGQQREEADLSEAGKPWWNGHLWRNHRVYRCGTYPDAEGCEPGGSRPDWFYREPDGDTRKVSGL